MAARRPGSGAAACRAWRASPGATAPAGCSLIEGTLLDTIFLGEMAQHRVRVGEDLVLKVFQLNPRPIAPGGVVRLAVEAEDVVMLRD